MEIDFKKEICGGYGHTLWVEISTIEVIIERGTRMPFMEFTLLRRI